MKPLTNETNNAVTDNIQDLISYHYLGALDSDHMTSNNVVDWEIGKRIQDP